VNTWLRRAALAAMLALGATRANAQITTVIAPPKRNAPNQQEVARREQVVQDSIARVTLTGMTQWVDSAAASLALRPDTGSAPASDTSAATRRTEAARGNPAVTAAQPATPQPAATREFRDGARAPNTATSIPTFAVFGGVMIMLGFIVRRQPRKSTARVSR
jgi:ATP-dependent exoDNAse (exonuclease V) beta subunit